MTTVMKEIKQNTAQIDMLCSAAFLIEQNMLRSRSPFFH